VTDAAATRSPLDILPRFGVFVKRDFLPADVRDDLRGRMQAAKDRPSPIGIPGGSVQVIEKERHARLVDLDEDAERIILGRLEAVRPEVEAVTGDAYRGLRPPQWLLYGEGHYHKPHRDYYEEENWERRISLLTFLNGESDDDRPDTFSGGQLVLYGVLGERHGIPISGEAGLLIGFRAGLFHEVRPVTRGRRYTVLSWFTV
jgi:predicted 2-oxoglutarate/Fe(II)-dependent dioxygenase YbiX